VDPEQGENRKKSVQLKEKRRKEPDSKKKRRQQTLMAAAIAFEKGAGAAAAGFDAGELGKTQKRGVEEGLGHESVQTNGWSEGTGRE